MHLVSSNSGGLPVELLWPYASSGLCLSFSLRLWCQRHLVTRHFQRTPEAAELERDYMTRPFGNAKQAKRNPIPKWWREKNVGKKTKTTSFYSHAKASQNNRCGAGPLDRYAFGIGTSVAVVVFSVIIARTSFKRLAKKISSSFAWCSNELQ